MAAITNNLKPALCIGLTLMSVLSCAAWSISADRKEFGRTGGSYTLEISNESYAPLFYRVGCEEDWVTISRSGDTDTTVKITVAKNEENLIHGRVATVNVAAYDYGSTPSSASYQGLRTCNIFQYGRGAAFSKDQVFLPGTNSSASVEVFVDGSTAWYMSSAESWLTVENGRGTGSGTVKLTASANDTGEARSASVQIHDAGGDPDIPYNANRVYCISVSQSPAPESFNIIYENLMGANNSNPASYYIGSSFEFKPLSSVKGYMFSGWVPAAVTAEDTGDVIVSATWEPIPYRIVYDASGGAGEIEDVECVYGQEVGLASSGFKHVGHELEGWSLLPAGGVDFEPGAVVSNLTSDSGASVTLYAVWRKAVFHDDPSNVEFSFSGDAEWSKCVEEVEVEKDGETLRYNSVWRSGYVTDNQKSVLSAKVYGAGKIGYWWKVSSESFRDWKLDNLEFAIDGVPQTPWINGKTDWRYLEFVVESSGEHVLTWTYSKDETDEGMDVGEDCGWITAAVWTPALNTLADYANIYGHELVSSGDALWTGDESVNHDGAGSIRNGDIGHGQSSTVTMQVDGAGKIGFWWKVSSESFRQMKLDYASFWIDGIEKIWMAGDVDWTNVVFDVIGDGVHTLEWRYSKDSEGSSGEDCVWVDEIDWNSCVSNIPELSVDEIESWVTGNLAPRFAKEGETVEEYCSRFAERFGSDPTAAMEMPTGKKDSRGNDMYVWQDFVVGTDPTDTNSVFFTKIEMVDGSPVISWSPALSAEEESLRVYTIYGKTDLSDETWHTPTNSASRFFKVGVDLISD